MLNDVDSEELAYQMAYDLVEAEQNPIKPSASPASPSQWIDLAGPNVFEELKRRMGMA